MAQPKFRIGDMVYTYQNPNYKARISHISESDDPNYQHSYKVALMENGYSKSSKWINESSITKRRTDKWLNENTF